MQGENWREFLRVKTRTRQLLLHHIFSLLLRYILSLLVLPLFLFDHISVRLCL
jgi:hypothetical protein